MKCTNCGAEIADSAEFCTECGTKVEKAEVAEETVETNVDETADETAKAAKKFTKGKLVAACVAGVLAVAIVIAGINYKACVNLFMRSTKEPAQYLKYVLGSTVKEMTGNAGEWYGLLGDTFVKNDEVASNTSVKVELGESGKTIINMLAVTQGLKTDWLDSVSVKYDSKMSDTKLGMNAVAAVNDVSQLSFEVLVDSESGMAYFSVPELSNKYIAANETELGIDFAELNTLSSREMKLLKDVLAASPSQSKFTQLLGKYADVALGSMDGGKLKKNSELSVESISQKCTKVSLNIDDELLEQMVVAMAKEAAADEAVKEWVKSLYTVLDQDGYLYELNLSGYTPDEAYDRFLGKLNDIAENGIDISLDKSKLSVYADSKGVMRGFELEYANNSLNVYYPHKGSSFACRVECNFDGSQYIFNGSGVDKNEKLDGILTFRIGDEKLVTLDLTAFDMKQLKKGYLNGEVRIRPTKNLSASLVDSIGNNYASMVSNVNLDIKMANSKKKSSFEVSAFEDNDLLLKASVNASLDSALKLKAPKNAKNISDDGVFEEYLNGLKYDKLYKSFDKANIPAEYKEYVEDLEDMEANDLIRLLKSSLY